jgi:DNA-binding LytR/AlgR family response regulator
VSYTVPHILSFWLYTIAGLGVYVIWRHVGSPKDGATDSLTADGFRETKAESHVGDEKVQSHFDCTVDGEQHTIACEEILFVESLENYVRIITAKKPLIVRMSLKEAEGRLPRPPFIRISRSCIVNSTHIKAVDSNMVTVNGQELKVGKVFKRYVEEFLK